MGALLGRLHNGILLQSFLVKSLQQRLETYCFCSVSYYYYYYYSSLSSLSFFLSFFPWTMNLSTADLRNYWTEFHETWWSYRYMFLVGPKVFSFVKGGQSHILRGSKGVGVTIESYGKVEISYINVANF